MLTPHVALRPSTPPPPSLLPHPTPTPLQIFTIHNMDFGAQKLGEAAFFSQKFTTVSPSYAWEVRAGAGAVMRRQQRQDGKHSRLPRTRGPATQIDCPLLVSVGATPANGPPPATALTADWRSPRHCAERRQADGRAQRH